MRRRYRIALVALLLCGLSTFAQVRPAAAAGIFMHQYNIKSATRYSNANLANARTYLAFAVNVNTSFYVVVNEMCASDYVYFATTFRGGPARMVHAKSNEPRCLGTNKAFGTGVFLLGSGEGAQVNYLSNPGLTCTNPTTECRVSLCLTANGILGRNTGCGTHLANGNPWLAGYQAAEFRGISTAYAPASLQWMGGDFNLIPGQVPADFWNNHSLLNIGDTVNPVGNLDRQYDYIWHRNQGIGYTFHSPFCPTDASDHCLVQAEH